MHVGTCSLKYESSPRGTNVLYSVVVLTVMTYCPTDCEPRLQLKRGQHYSANLFQSTIGRISCVKKMTLKNLLFDWAQQLWVLWDETAIWIYFVLFQWSMNPMLWYIANLLIGFVRYNCKLCKYYLFYNIVFKQQLFLTDLWTTTCNNYVVLTEINLNLIKFYVQGICTFLIYYLNSLQSS